MSYVYIQSEIGSVWTVGFYTPANTWIAESDWDSKEKAAERARWMNGGDAIKQPEARPSFPDIDDVEILKAMRNYGGTFAAQLALAGLSADKENLKQLKQAFPDLWQRYAKFVPEKTQ